MRLTLYDIAGSMNLANKAYNIISIMRVDSMDIENAEYKKLALDMLKSRYDIEGASTVLEILKTKGIGCGLIGLVYEKETKTFREQPTITFDEAERLKYKYTDSRKRSDKECNPF